MLDTKLVVLAGPTMSSERGVVRTSTFWWMSLWDLGDLSLYTDYRD